MKIVSRNPKALQLALARREAEEALISALVTLENAHHRCIELGLLAKSSKPVGIRTIRKYAEAASRVYIDVEVLEAEAWERAAYRLPSEAEIIDMAQVMS